MIVLIIMAGVLAAAVGKLGGRNSDTKKVLRELTNLSKELHIKAKLKGATYRLVIDMKEGNKGDIRQTYWVERSDKSILMSKDEEEKMREESEKLARDKEAKTTSSFQQDSSILKEPRKMPKGMFFEFVELSRAERPVSTGKAYIHYLPQGLVDEAAIHLIGERDVKWTISIHPLTGRAELISNNVSLKELKDQ